MLFIFFNGGLTSEQWYTHPYEENIKTDLINQIEKLGKIYLYDPIFYTKKGFTIDDLNLINHCKSLYDTVKDISNEYFLISHSRGHILAHIFISLYGKHVKGFINIDGGSPELGHLNILSADNIKYENTTNDDLEVMFNDIKNNNKEAKSKLSNIVKYFMYKQYNAIIIYFNFDFPVYILNNIYHNDEINLNMDDYVKTTLIDKIKFNEQFSKNKNVKSIYYVNKTHFLYFGMEEDILDMIKRMLGYKLCNGKNMDRYKSIKYKTKYIKIKNELEKK